jgi:hypothetical protein
MLKISKIRSHFKVKRSKIMAPIERSCHKEYIYESPITYHSKYMANVKVYADKQTYGQTKNYMPQIFRYGGIKSFLAVISVLLIQFL